MSSTRRRSSSVFKPWYCQMAEALSPNAVSRWFRLGSAKFQTRNFSGTSAAKPSAVNRTLPEYSPAGASSGT
jgi:hypothetical protein